MNCRETIEFLRHYLDGELPENVKACFDMHLEACPPCLDYMTSYKATVALAKKACREGAEENCDSIPEDLVRAIVRAQEVGREPSLTPRKD